MAYHCDNVISSLFHDVGSRLFDGYRTNNNGTKTTRHIQPIHQANNERHDQRITSLGERSQLSKRLFPLSEDAMRHLENGTAAMFDYLIHDGRKNN